MNDQSFFVASARIITEANRRVLGKTLTLDDSRDYITSLVKADAVLVKSSVTEIAQSAEASVGTGTLALSEWSDNRSRGLLYLLRAVKQSAILDVSDSSQASALCTIALAREPLIPSLSLVEYAKLVTVSHKLLSKSFARQPDIARLYSTYNLACIYNAQAFSPGIFVDKITPVLVSQSWSKFLIELRNIQSEEPQLID